MPHSPESFKVSNHKHSYLESVSDLVSALIFVFIIMLAVFAYQLANITTNFMSAHTTREKILREIESKLKNAGMAVEVVSDQGILRLTENAINFPSGDDKPIVTHNQNVGRVARAIADVVPCYVAAEQDVELNQVDGPVQDISLTDGTDVSERPSFCQDLSTVSTNDCAADSEVWRVETLLVEGHTDEIPVSTGNRFRNNIELSSMRSATVYNMISSCEPRISNLLNSQGYSVLSTSGYGPTRPVTADQNRLMANRRIDLRFLMEPPLSVSNNNSSAQHRNQGRLK